jgi:hypothetical protein
MARRRRIGALSRLAAANAFEGESGWAWTALAIRMRRTCPTRAARFFAAPRTISKNCNGHGRYPPGQAELRPDNDHRARRELCVGAASGEFGDEQLIMSFI